MKCGGDSSELTGIFQGVFESPNVFVFGEFLQLEKIRALEKETTGNGKQIWDMLNLFAYGTFKDSAHLPLTDAMKKKLRLLTISTLATRNKTLKYQDLQRELELDSVRQLEDLIIEGSNYGVLVGKLDQKSSTFQVDYAKGRDIRKEDIQSVISTLSSWCQSCDGVLTCLENQALRAEGLKEVHVAHKASIAEKLEETKAKLKSSHRMQQMNAPEGYPDHPDSRMDVDEGLLERREKKSSKSKGLRGVGKKNIIAPSYFLSK